jgi:hypothetical protein
LDLVQIEAGVTNTVARAQASTSPPALIYVGNSVAGTMRAFDLVTNPVTQSFTFRRLPTDPDASGPPYVADLASANLRELAFSPGGNLAVFVEYGNPGQGVFFDVAKHAVALALPGLAQTEDLLDSPSGEFLYILDEGSWDDGFIGVAR